MIISCYRIGLVNPEWKFRVYKNNDNIAFSGGGVRKKKKNNNKLVVHVGSHRRSFIRLAEKKTIVYSRRNLFSFDSGDLALSAGKTSFSAEISTYSPRVFHRYVADIVTFDVTEDKAV